MSTNEVTRNLLAEHYKKYPELQLQDIFKYIYQSSFGCEHMVPSLDALSLRLTANLLRFSYLFSAIS